MAKRYGPLKPVAKFPAKILGIRSSPVRGEIELTNHLVVLVNLRESAVVVAERLRYAAMGPE